MNEESESKSGLRISWEAIKFGFGVLLIAVAGLMAYAYLNGGIVTRLDGIDTRLERLGDELKELRRKQ